MKKTKEVKTVNIWRAKQILSVRHGRLIYPGELIELDEKAAMILLSKNAIELVEADPNDDIIILGDKINDSDN